MKNTLKKARRVRCISCGKWCASARYKNHPHGSNIYDWAKGGTIHGNCVVREWDELSRRRHKEWTAKHKNPDGSWKIPPIWEIEESIKSN